MDTRIEKALLFISKNLHSKIPLSTLANEACLSEFHFHRLFKATTKFPPLEYINKLRLEYAAHYLIVYPEAKYQEVAFECGFSSPANFSRSFSKFFKVSPSAYRNKKGAIKPTATFLGVEPVLKPSNLPVQYFSHLKLIVQRVNLEEQELNNYYKKLIGEHQKSLDCVGFFLDMPFHVAHDQCRYYVARENNEAADDKGHFLEISGGYYTQVEIKGTFEDMEQILKRFKREYIDPSGYIIKSLFGFERITLPEHPDHFSYFKTPRTLFIRIGRK